MPPPPEPCAYALAHDPDGCESDADAVAEYECVQFVPADPMHDADADAEPALACADADTMTPPPPIPPPPEPRA
jgi:hypothetical protein